MRKNKQTANRQTNKPLSFDCVDKPGGGTDNLCSRSEYCVKICKYLSPIVHDFWLCRKINRETNGQTNKHLRLDCVDKPRGPTLKVLSLARSVNFWFWDGFCSFREKKKPVKVASLARSVQKPLMG